MCEVQVPASALSGLFVKVHKHVKLDDQILRAQAMQEQLAAQDGAGAASQGAPAPPHDTEIELHRSPHSPPWSGVEGKYFVNLQGSLPDEGSILRGVHVWEVPFAPMLSPGLI